MATMRTTTQQDLQRARQQLANQQDAEQRRIEAEQQHRREIEALNYQITALQRQEAQEKFEAVKQENPRLIAANDQAVAALHTSLDEVFALVFEKLGQIEARGRDVAKTHDTQIAYREQGIQGALDAQLIGLNHEEYMRQGISAMGHLDEYAAQLDVALPVNVALARWIQRWPVTAEKERRVAQAIITMLLGRGQQSDFSGVAPDVDLRAQYHMYVTRSRRG